MGPRNGSRALFCGLLALVATAALGLVDAWRIDAAETQEGLRLARQVADQGMGLFLAARRSGERDPLVWAVNFLAQGVEPRVIRVAAAFDQSGPRESWKRDTSGANAVLEYARIVAPERKAAIRVWINQGFEGYLGTRSPFARDLALGLTFVFLWAFGLIAIRALRPASPEVADEGLRQLVRDKVAEARVLLTSLGVHVREMVREAQNLAVASSKSRELLTSLRERVHGELRELHECRQALRDSGASAVQAEVAALNLVIEASRLGEEGRGLGAMAEELHRLAQRVRILNQKSETAVGRVELQMEPLATDADVAFHAYDDVDRATRSMDSHIAKTTETLIGQAKLMQAFGKEVGPTATSGALEPPGEARSSELKSA